MRCAGLIEHRRQSAKPRPNSTGRRVPDELERIRELPFNSKRGYYCGCSIAQSPVLPVVNDMRGSKHIHCSGPVAVGFKMVPRNYQLSALLLDQPGHTHLADQLVGGDRAKQFHCDW